MSEVKWNCQIDQDLFPDPQVQLPSGKVINGLTVGRKFLLSCQGETGTLRTEILKFDTGKENDYRINLVEVRHMSEHESEYVVTSYVAGDHRFKELFLTDGLSKKKIENLRFQVNTVLDPKTKEPVGPMGPIALSLPWHFYAGIGVAIGLVVIAIGFRIFRRVQRNRLFEDLKQHNTALGAYNQLQKDLRVMQREFTSGLSKEAGSVDYQQATKELDSLFRLFLVRELIIPANQWGIGLIEKEIKRRHPKIFRSSGKLLRDHLIELEKSMESGTAVTQVDFEQLVNQTRKLADLIHRGKRK